MKFMFNSYYPQKGITLYLVIVVLAILLAMVLGLTVVLVTQLKMVRNLGNSVVALYAADTGIEKGLKMTIRPGGVEIPSSYEDSLSNGAEYDAEIVCCQEGSPNCVWVSGNPCPVPLQEDPNCDATRFCIRSVGTYQGVKRALQAKVYPVD